MSILYDIPKQPFQGVLCAEFINNVKRSPLLAEAAVGVAEGVVGIDAVAAGPVDEGEEAVAEVGLGQVVGQRLGRPNADVAVGAAGGAAGHLLLHADGLDERGQRVGHPVEDPLWSPSRCFSCSQLSPW